MPSSVRLNIVTGFDVSLPTTKQEYYNELANLLARCASGERNVAISGAVDTEVGVQATITVACDRTQATDGDKLNIILPDGQFVVLSVLASGAVAANGQISSATSNTAMGDSLVACFQQVGTLSRFFTASNSTGTVTITARDRGSYWNGLLVTKTVTNAGVFTIGGSGRPTNGTSITDRPTATFTCTQASIVNNSTTIIGTVTLTWKTSGASGENELNIGSTNAEAATNLQNAINNHSALRGVVVAAVESTNVCRLTYWCTGRQGELVRTTGTTGVVASGGGLTSTVTSTFSANPVNFATGL